MMGTTKSICRMMVILGCLLLGVALAQAQATVTTDKDDYYPGETVIITGSGWEPGETVLLTIESSFGHYYELSAIANAQGEIYNDEFIIQPDHLGAVFLLTAIGQSSGQVATAIFTDAPKIGSVTLNPTSQSTCAGGSVSYTVTINRGTGQGSTGAFAAGLSVSGLPSGVTATFSPSPVSFTGGQNSGQSTLTLSTTSSVPPGTYPFTVRAEVQGTPTDFATTTGTLVVNAPPIVTTHPVSQTVCDGATVTFTAAASGSPVPTVQWQVSTNGGATWSNIPGATATTLSFTASASQNGNQYRAVFTNPCGSATTNAATLTVNSAPTLNCPSAITVNNDAGQCSAQIDLNTYVSASGTPAPTITYTVNGNPIPAVYSFPVGPTTVVATATNSCGSDTCTFTVTVNDTEDPTITCPADVTVNADAGQCYATGVNLGTPTTSDNCGVASVTNNAPAQFPVGTTIVTWTVTDVNGNTATCTQTVTVVDNEPPTVNCPAPITVSNDPGQCGAVVTFTVSASDNCGVASIVANPASGSFFPVGTTTVTVTVTDIHGNTSTCTFTVTVNDTENPTISNCPSDIVVNNDPGQCGAVVSWTPPTASDNCAGVNLSGSHAPGSFFPVGTTTITYTATDAAGNTTTCSFTVTVIDNTPPSLSCPTSLSASADANCQAAIPDVLGIVSASDNCTPSSGITLIQSPAAGTLVGLGTHTITVTATDAAGNSSQCVISFTVSDATPPSINCPPNVTRSAGSDCTYTLEDFTGSATASDNCDTDLTITQSPAPGTPLAPGTHTITLTATDDAGNSSSCTFTVTVVDDTPPTVNCPAPITVSNDPGQCGAVVTFTVSASDNCGVASIVANPASGSFFPVGTTPVTVTVTDIHGNTSTCTFTVTVNDTENPTINDCPPNITIYTGAGATTCSATATWTQPTASDNCPGVSLTSTHNPGDSFPVGTTTVTYTATDAAGNTTTCSFTVTVIDNTPPVLQGVPGDATVECDSVPAPATVTATDNCDPNPQVQFEQTITPGSCADSYIITRTWTATDQYGNTASATQVITVQDTTPPTITCPADVTVNADAGECHASNVDLGTVSASDNCDTDVQIVGVRSDGLALTDPYPVGTTTITWTATDNCGNSVSCEQTVTVLDNQPPVISCPADILNAPADMGACSATLNVGLATATDNCPGVTVVGVRSDGQPLNAPYPVGTTTITWTATDASGLTATCIQTIVVVDTQAPIINCPPNLNVGTDPGMCHATLNVGAATATDNCGVASVVGVRSDGQPLNAPYPVGVTTIVWTATDIYGNSSQCVQTITVSDTEAPTVNCPAPITVSNDPGQCGAVVTFTVSASDNCGVASIVANPASGSFFPVGTTPVTVTVTDIHGNTSTCTFTVTVNDTEDPTITCPADVTVNADAGQCYATGVNLGTPTTSDNCGVASVTNNAPAQFPVGTTIVTWTVTDIYGNTATCTQTVTVIDNQPPSITCPNNITVNNDPNRCDAQVNVGTPSTSDNCGVASVQGVRSDNRPLTDPYPVGTTTITWTVTDVNGNTNSCQQTVTVIDAQAPSIVCPANIVVNADPGHCSALLNLPQPTVSDNCGVASVVGVRSDGLPLTDPFPVCTTTITWTVTDIHGNSSQCVQTVTVKANVQIEYIGDLMVYTPGPTNPNGQALLAARLLPEVLPPCADLTQVQVRFEVWRENATTGSYVGAWTVPVNSDGLAGVLVNLTAGSNGNGQQYEVKVSIVPNNCWASDDDSALLNVDYGSAERRVTGGGWVPFSLSENGKANFGFTVGYERNGRNLKGQAVYMVRGTDGYNYKVKSNSWQGGSLIFTKNLNTGRIDRARFSGKCNIQQIDRTTGEVVGSIGNCTFVVEIYDGDMYNPRQKDRYAIWVFLPNGSLWWGSVPNLTNLGGDGPGGGNVTIHLGP